VVCVDEMRVVLGSRWVHRRRYATEEVVGRWERMKRLISISVKTFLFSSSI